MVCFVCRKESPGCDFSLDNALENIMKHYKLMEIAVQEAEKENGDLKERNNKLLKAVECLKKPSTLARLNSFSQQSEQPAPVSSPIFEDITVIEDDEEIGVMDTMNDAMNGSGLNTSCNNEVITETEHPNWQGRRRIALKLRSKPTATKNSSNDNSDCNDENKKPSPKSTETAVSKQNLDLAPKEPAANANRSFIKRLSLKQTRLKFNAKRDKSAKGGTPRRTLTFGGLNKAKDKSNSLSDEDVFDFNKSASFQFKSPSPKKPKFFEISRNFFPFPKDGDDSVIVMPSPTQTICFLDDTVEEENHPKSVTPKKVKRLEFDDASENRKDSLADFDIPKGNDDKPAIPAKTSIQKSVPSTNVKIKEEPAAQKTTKKAINPIFHDSDTAEESDDDFIVLPMKIKVEPEKKRPIDIDSIDCVDCRNYIKFCGERMTVEKLEEHIRNCVNHKNQRDELRGETPEGFWNPLLVSFAEDDPRNEVLIDKRFSDKDKDADSRKNS